MSNFESHPTYGGTSPIANLCKEYNIPDWIGFCIADILIHNRQGYWSDEATKWIVHSMYYEDQMEFYTKLDSICEYKRKYQ